MPATGHSAPRPHGPGTVDIRDYGAVPVLNSGRTRAQAVANRKAFHAAFADMAARQIPYLYVPSGGYYSVDGPIYGMGTGTAIISDGPAFARGLDANLMPPIIEGTFGYIGPVMMLGADPITPASGTFVPLASVLDNSYSGQPTAYGLRIGVGGAQQAVSFWSDPFSLLDDNTGTNTPTAWGGGNLQVCLEFAFQGGGGAAFPGAANLLTLGDVSTANPPFAGPWSIYTDGSGNMSVYWWNADGTHQAVAWAAPTGTGLYRFTVQWDYKNGAFIAAQDGTIVATATLATGVGLQPLPPGRLFRIGALGLSPWTYAGANGAYGPGPPDVVLCGLQVRPRQVYVNGALNGTLTTVKGEVQNDKFRYFSGELYNAANGTVNAAYLPLQDNASSTYPGEVTGYWQAGSYTFRGFWYSTRGAGTPMAWPANLGLHDLVVMNGQLANYGDAVTFGQIWYFGGERLKFSGGWRAMAGLITGTNNFYWSFKNLSLFGYNACLYQPGACAFYDDTILLDGTPINTPIQVDGGNASFTRTVLNMVPTAGYYFQGFQSAGGANPRIVIDDIQDDNESVGPTKAYFGFSGSSSSGGLEVRITNKSYGSGIYKDAPLVELGPGYGYGDNTLVLDNVGFTSSGPLVHLLPGATNWNVEIDKCVGRYMQRVSNEAGIGPRVRDRITHYGPLPPREGQWNTGMADVRASGAVPGQFARWEVAQAGVFGTPSPPIWLGRDVVGLPGTNALAGYLTDRHYLGGPALSTAASTNGSPLPDYLAGNVVRWLFGGTWAAGTNANNIVAGPWYWQLAIIPPWKDGTRFGYGAPSESSYAPVAAALTSANWTLSGSTLTFAPAIAFPAPAGPWSSGRTLAGLALATGTGTSANTYPALFGTLASPLTIAAAGAAPTFPANGVVLTHQNPTGNLGTLTTYAFQQWAKKVFQSDLTAPTAPATWYFGLSTTPPALDGSGVTEPAIGTNGYARAAVANNTTNFGATAIYGTCGNSGQVYNATAIAFPTPTGEWASGGNLAYWFVADAATGGNVWAYGAIPAPAVVSSASSPTPSFAPGAWVAGM